MLNKFAAEVHANSREKGWWEECEFDVTIPGTGIEAAQFDPSNRNVGETCMLIVTEIAEAYEEYRNGRGMNEVYYKDGKPEGIPIEFADAIIRLCDTAAAHGIDLDEALRIKAEYNKSRPYRHGNKKA